MAFEIKVIEVIGDQEVAQIRLINKNNVIASFLTLGATWQEFLVPTINDESKNLLLGFNKPSDYGKNTLCAAQTIGRTAGRIANGQATIDGKIHQLPINNNGNTLHGGPNGFHIQNWNYEIIEGTDFVGVRFTYAAKQEVDGYPGDMDAVATFKLDDNNHITMTFTGKNATETTLFNPTIHPYFNLSQYQDLYSHTMTVRSDYVLEVNDELIPSGKFLDVTGTHYDFREGQNLGKAISQNNGFDDTWVVNNRTSEPIIILTDEESGDQLRVFSERQGVVIYTMNSLEEGVFFARDKGIVGHPQEGVAIEPQDLPDAVNHTHFDQVFLKPGEEKSYRIVFEYENMKRSPL